MHKKYTKRGRAAVACGWFGPNMSQQLLHDIQQIEIIVHKIYHANEAGQYGPKVKPGIEDAVQRMLQGIEIIESDVKSMH